MHRQQKYKCFIILHDDFQLNVSRIPQGTLNCGCERSEYLPTNHGGRINDTLRCHLAICLQYNLHLFRHGIFHRLSLIPLKDTIQYGLNGCRVIDTSARTATSAVTRFLIQPKGNFQLSFQTTMSPLGHVFKQDKILCVGMFL